MDDKLTATWFDPLFRTESMRRLFSDFSRLQGILDFEAALARAQARAGLIPAAAAKAIDVQCRAEHFNLTTLSQASVYSGNSAIPVIKELTRLVESSDPAAAQYVHWGATSQDAMDTGLVLQLRQGLDLIDADTRLLCAALAKLAEEYKETPMAGRTWLQHAAPTTFGLKVAGWLCAIARQLERLRAARSQASVLQLGGAVGTLAAFGDHADKTVTLLAEELYLQPAEVPWHTHRDRLVEVAVTLGVLVGSLGKIARDIGLMTQSEVAEVAEPSLPGRGGSSSMPQKRNPIGCASVLATATRLPGLVSTMLAAMSQEHERALGGWQAEWETLPEILQLASGAVCQMAFIISGLQVDAARMRANLEITRGQIYAESVSTALARKVGHAKAHNIMEIACRKALDEGHHLRDVVSADTDITTHLSPTELAALFDPQQHVRAAARRVDQALASTALRLSSSNTEGKPCPSPK